MWVSSGFSTFFWSLLLIIGSPFPSLSFPISHPPPLSHLPTPYPYHPAFPLPSPSHSPFLLFSWRVYDTRVRRWIPLFILQSCTTPDPSSSFFTTRLLFFRLQSDVYSYSQKRSFFNGHYLPVRLRVIESVNPHVPDVRNEGKLSINDLVTDRLLGYLRPHSLRSGCTVRRTAEKPED
jgi:hypothetical protein